MAIQFTLGDITTARVDAIVNAANPTLLGGGGVDGALHRAAGGALLTACQALPAKNGVRCQPGEAQITTAGHLAAQYVIHTVGPVYHQDPTPALTLTRAYQHSCELAIANQCKSLAIPAISCGVYGYPHQEAARIALTSCIPFANTLDINFYLFDRALFEVFVAEWQKQQCNIQQ